MVDVNEEIVRRFYEMHGYLVRTNVRFEKRKEVSGKKAKGYGDIDLVVYNPRTHDMAAVSVSGWHQESITFSHAKQARIFDITTEAATDAVKRLVGEIPFRKVLVISKLGSSDSARGKFLAEASKRGIDEVVEFPQVIRFLQTWVSTRRGYDSETLQVLALLRNYRINANTSQAILLWREKGILRSRWFCTNDSAAIFSKDLTENGLSDTEPTLLGLEGYTGKHKMAKPDEPP